MTAGRSNETRRSPATWIIPVTWTIYNINLNAGDEIELVAEAQPYAPTLWIDYRGAPEGSKALAPSKDALGDSWDKWTYRAPHTGRYFLEVEDEGDVQIQGYVLQVKDVPATAKPQDTQLPEDDLAAATLPYRSDQGIFGIRYPKEWTAQERAPGVAAVYASEEGGALEIVERDMLSLGMGKLDARRVREPGPRPSERDSTRLQAVGGRTLRDRGGPDRRDNHLQRPRRGAKMRCAALPARRVASLRCDLLRSPGALS